MKTFEIGYIMGIVTGEGSFTGDKAQPCLCVSLHACDDVPIHLLHNLLGGMVYGPYMHKDGRTSIRWMLRGPDLIAALPLFDQYLLPSRKREQYDEWRLKWADYFSIPSGKRVLSPEARQVRQEWQRKVKQEILELRKKI